jgi:eukaryotic-like serine/threonine-protein kinase
VDDDTPAGGSHAVGSLTGRVVGGRYRVENVVSTGANTIITEAIDVESDTPVTVKIVQPELAVHASFREAFARRTEGARSLTHPNIARVLDAGEVDVAGQSTLFWVVEYLGGGSLRDLYDRGRLLEPSQALIVGLEAARALQAAHEQGVVHTELTPSKMVFGEDARLRVVDFGMAELLGAEAWAEPATVPTHVARYASPEQALAIEVDEKTDVYALSLCLIEGITGSVPFAGDSTVSTLAARVGKLMPVTAEMGSLAAVLERAGRPEAEDRWTAEEFGNALVQAAGALPRPDPIPIMASSLFAVSMSQRRDADVVPDAVSDAIVAEALDTDEDHVAEEFAPVDEPTGETPVDEPTVEVPVGEPAADRTVEMPAAAVAGATAATAPPTTQMSAIDGSADGTFYDAETESRRRGRSVGLVLLILTGLVALGVAAFFVLRTPSYEVPDLVGVDQAVAINEISGNGWVIETERERSDAVPQVDHVVRTIPAAGEMLAEGETFVIVVSDGPELRTIPELVGVPLAEAQATLTELRLVGVESGSEFSEDVPQGAVLRWQVEGDASLVAGAQVLPDTRILLTVSDGPEPRPAPDLGNQTVDEATATLAGVQLVIARAEDVFSNDVEAGRVVSQDPPPGTPVPRDGTVTVAVSKGPDLVPFPDLTGLTYPAALEALNAAGFTQRSVLGTTDGTFVSASIGGTAAQPGSTFPRGSAVDLIFL